uniref:Late nodulin domain-containing protein n=3 Tax=Medicago truncatula TaxID=3880 RepID=G7JH24_MEDTR|nr:unknown [Medicago truncatula]
MQIGKNMVETQKLVYVILLFLSIFLFTNSPLSQIIFSECKTDKDCPKYQRANIRCRKGQCVRI